MGKYSTVGTNAVVAYVFRDEGGVWEGLRRLGPTDGAASDAFG